LLREQRGQIRIDGVVLTPENKDAWQRILGYLQQDVFILEGTLLENILFGDDTASADFDKIAGVMKKVHLDEFLASLPDGLDTKIGESGARLSGGQKQRVAIARALYKDAEVFIFDEATSALDPETEIAITDAISALAADGKTIFIIAHRFTTLKGCSRIYELREGTISAEYRYTDLMRIKLGLVEGH